MCLQADGYMTSVAKYGPKEFINRQMGMLQEVMAEYGPVNRFWFDGTKNVRKAVSVTGVARRS